MHPSALSSGEMFRLIDDPRRSFMLDNELYQTTYAKQHNGKIPAALKETGSRWLKMTDQDVDLDHSNRWHPDMSLWVPGLNPKVAFYNATYAHQRTDNSGVFGSTAAFTASSTAYGQFHRWAAASALPQDYALTALEEMGHKLWGMPPRPNTAVGTCKAYDSYSQPVAVEEEVLRGNDRPSELAAKSDSRACHVQAQSAPQVDVEQSTDEQDSSTLQQSVDADANKTQDHDHQGIDASFKGSNTMCDRPNVVANAEKCARQGFDSKHRSAAGAKSIAPSAASGAAAEGPPPDRPHRFLRLQRGQHSIRRAPSCHAGLPLAGPRVLARDSSNQRTTKADESAAAEVAKSAAQLSERPRAASTAALAQDPALDDVLKSARARLGSRERPASQQGRISGHWQKLLQPSQAPPGAAGLDPCLTASEIERSLLVVRAEQLRLKGKMPGVPPTWAGQPTRELILNNRINDGFRWRHNASNVSALLRDGDMPSLEQYQTCKMRQDLAIRRAELGAYRLLDTKGFGTRLSGATPDWMHVPCVKRSGGVPQRTQVYGEW